MASAHSNRMSAEAEAEDRGWEQGRADYLVMLDEMQAQRDRARDLAAHLEAELAQADDRVWRAGNLLRGKCRYCLQGDYPSGDHRMRCQHYVGPLEHHMRYTRMNPTFGGSDYECTCGSYLRIGDMFDEGDPNREPVCKRAGETWRGPQTEASA